MKIGAFTTTHSEADWVELIVPQLCLFDSAIVVLSKTPMGWFSRERPSPAAPVERVRNLCEQHGITLIVDEFDQVPGSGTGLGRQRQRGLDTLRSEGCVAAVWMAPDELYELPALRRLRACIESNPHAIWNVAGHALWWNEDWEVGYFPPSPGLPIDFDCAGWDAGDVTRIAAAYQTRGLWKTAPDVRCWHFAFARPEDDMYTKFFSYGHAHDEHSERHWESWDKWAPGKSVYGLGCVPTRCPEPLPKELRGRLAKILPQLRRLPAEEMKSCRS